MPCLCQAHAESLHNAIPWPGTAANPLPPGPNPHTISPKTRETICSFCSSQRKDHKGLRAHLRDSKCLLKNVNAADLPRLLFAGLVLPYTNAPVSTRGAATLTSTMHTSLEAKIDTLQAQIRLQEETKQKQMEALSQRVDRQEDLAKQTRRDLRSLQDGLEEGLKESRWGVEEKLDQMGKNIEKLGRIVELAVGKMDPSRDLFSSQANMSSTPFHYTKRKLPPKKPATNGDIPHRHPTVPSTPNSDPKNQFESETDSMEGYDERDERSTNATGPYRHTSHRITPSSALEDQYRSDTDSMEGKDKQTTNSTTPHRRSTIPITPSSVLDYTKLPKYSFEEIVDDTVSQPDSYAEDGLKSRAFSSTPSEDEFSERAGGSQMWSGAGEAGRKRAASELKSDDEIIRVKMPNDGRKRRIRDKVGLDIQAF